MCVTLRCALTATGDARPHAAAVDGAIAEGARQDNEDAYPELASGTRCELVVVALETGGRWNEQDVELIDDLASARAQSVPTTLRTPVRHAFI